VERNAYLIRVGLAAPNLAARLGLQALLESEAVFAVNASASSLSALLDQAGELDLLVVMDEAMLDELPPGEPEPVEFPPVLLLTDTLSAVQTLSTLPLRAWGLLPEDVSAKELSIAGQALFLGLVTAPPDALLVLFSPILEMGESQSADINKDILTEREIEVLQLLAHGLANKQIALALEISAHTVKFHVSSIYNKLGATNRTEAVRFGLQSGLINL
jgi:two-component system, NarL family, response regulator YdfI